MSSGTPDTSEILSRPPRPLDVDLDAVRSLWRAPGPFVSAFVDLRTPATARADAWEAERNRLGADGAPEPAISVIGSEIAREPGEYSSSLAVLAAADGTMVSVASPDPLVAPLAVVESLPRTAPVIDWAQRAPTHLVVEVDARVSTVLVFHADGSVVSHEIRLGPADVVGDIARLVVDQEAEVVVLGGPSDLVRGVRSVLTPMVPSVGVVEVPDPSEDELATSAVRAVADDVARETVGELRALRLGRESNETADGVVEVVDALRAGRVDSLVIHDDPSDPRHVWFGDGAREVAIDLEHAGALDTSTLRRGRLTEALIRSCVLQGGTVRVVPGVDEGRLPGGVGAALVRPA